MRTPPQFPPPPGTFAHLQWLRERCEENAWRQYRNEYYSAVEKRDRALSAARDRYNDRLQAAFIEHQERYTECFKIPFDMLQVETWLNGLTNCLNLEDARYAALLAEIEAEYAAEQERISQQFDAEMQEASELFRANFDRCRFPEQWRPPPFISLLIPVDPFNASNDDRTVQYPI